MGQEDRNKLVIGNQSIVHEGVKAFVSLWALKNGCWFTQESEDLPGVKTDVVIRKSKGGRVLNIEVQHDMRHGKYVTETKERYGSRPLLILDLNKLEKDIPELEETFLLLYETLSDFLEAELEYTEPKRTIARKKKKAREYYYKEVEGKDGKLKRKKVFV